MTDDDLRKKVEALAQEVDDLREQQERLTTLPDAVAKLHGTVETLQALVMSRFDRVDGGVEKAASIRTAITFASVVIVPILVAIIGGYFALKAGLASAN